MNKKINLYFFGDPGIYDEYNPAYVCNRNFASEILYLIAYNEPFSISKSEIIKELKIHSDEFNEIIGSLDKINAIDIKGDKYKINFPVFLENDMPLLDKYFMNIGEVIGNEIIESSGLIYEKISKLTSYSNFSKERLLYHIICDDIFDGTAFEFFTEKDIFRASKMQPGNRDYIIVGYEDSMATEEHSNGILCSSNNYRSKSFVFNSFGDSEGTRKDMFRFFRRVQKILESATPFKDLNLAYIRIIDDNNKEIAEKCGELVWKSFKGEINYNELSHIEINLVNFLSELGYLIVNEQNSSISCNVPIFESEDRKVINDVSDIILKKICGLVKETFERFEEDAKGLTPIKHKVSIKEIAIELWHQVFGFTNEYLVKKGFVELPEYRDGEGRYLRSFSTEI